MLEEGNSTLQNNKIALLALYVLSMFTLFARPLYAQPAPEGATVPYHQLNINVQYILVRINDQTNARMLVDTGAAYTLLFKSMADQLHLAVERPSIRRRLTP